MTATDPPRITPEEVAEAYRVTGLTPRRGQTIPTGTGLVCGLGALYVATHPEENNRPTEDAVLTYADNRYGGHYATGFYHGFDSLGKISDMEDFLRGYDDGQAAAEAVFP